MASGPVTPPVNPPVNRQYVPVRRRRNPIFGAVVMIGLGVVFLLVSMGRVTPATVFIWFAQYWPLLLILWGVLKLIEYMQAGRQGLPAPGIGAGGVVLAIFLVLAGMGVTAAYRSSQHVNWGAVRDEIQVDDNDFGSLFGGQRRESQGSVAQDFAAGSSLKILGDHGKITVQPSEDKKLHVDYTRVVYANQEKDAEQLESIVNPVVTMAGGMVTVDASRRDQWKGGHIDMTVSVPRKAALDIQDSHGAVAVNDRDGDVKVTSSHGDVTIEKLAGNADVHIDHGNFKASAVKGDVVLAGAVDDTDVSDISGTLKCDGEFFGDLKMHALAKGIQFKSSRTDLSFVKLDGDFDMSGSDLRADQVTGPMVMNTRSKDIHIEDMNGDVRIENRNAEIEVHAKTLGNVELDDRSGAINLVVPGSSGFDLDARARGGEIDSDFDLKTTESGSDASASGVVGKGGPKVKLTTDNGTISVRKG